MGLLAKADCQRLIAESLPKCFGCGYAALCRYCRYPCNRLMRVDRGDDALSVPILLRARICKPVRKY